MHDQLYIDVPPGQEMPNVEVGGIMTLLKGKKELRVPVIVDEIEGRRIFFHNLDG